MSDPVFYFRGFPSGVRPLVDNPEAVADLLSVASVTEVQASEIRDRLAEASGFLDLKAMRAIVREVIADDSVAQAVLRVRRYLEPKDVKPLLDTLSERLAQPEFAFDEVKLEGLRLALTTLIQRYPAVERFEKANRLAELTGQQLESLELICDIRPIFDEGREQLEGMMPYTRLRVVATGADGLPTAFEAELTLEQVGDLESKASKAKSKLEVLRESIQTWLPNGLPDLPLTRASLKESSDA